jgi:predicted fused transcriptional regulator/phosphomethylpyrimidine kinase/predicted transcriptional regulator
MRFVEEIVVDEFLPTFRSLLAERLREEGLTQHEVANLLGLSQSAVSKYVQGEVAQNERLLADEELRALVDRLADGLASGEMRPVQALVEAEVFVRKLERGGALASLHEAAMPELAAYDDDRFAVHDPDSTVRAAERVRSSLGRGLRRLQTTGNFAALVPAVGSNLVECLPDAEGIEDVAGVPGRILAPKGQVSIPGEPEFGSSEHVARVLLAAREHGVDARAALNVRYDEATLAALEAMDLTAVAFDAESAIEDAIAAALADVDASDVDVLYQRGGFGIEPIIYVLAADAPAAASVVREL